MADQESMSPSIGRDQDGWDLVERFTHSTFAIADSDSWLIECFGAHAITVHECEMGFYALNISKWQANENMHIVHFQSAHRPGG